MTYPVVVSIMVVGIVAAMLVFIVPTFENLDASLGGTLPLPTRMLMGASNVLRRFFLVVVLLVVGVVFLVRRWKATDSGRYQWDRFKQALEIVGETVNNMVISRAIRDVQDSVREGESLATPLSKHATFPAMVVQMMTVGEETGALDTMLSKVADLYDQEVEADRADGGRADHRDPHRHRHRHRHPDLPGRAHPGPEPGGAGQPAQRTHGREKRLHRRPGVLQRRQRDRAAGAGRAVADLRGRRQHGLGNRRQRARLGAGDQHRGAGDQERLGDLLLPQGHRHRHRCGTFYHQDTTCAAPSATAASVTGARWTA